ncbi:hypothetical protein [Halomicrobium salinisoli]|uniref:hypothetical protein n=1 Tax=Halomicrobium salinisoli TaxID=2878391 RepID=UPI001CEFFB4C|nr:hypothetical protein [Halomicrobium salinisoli]
MTNALAQDREYYRSLIEALIDGFPWLPVEGEPSVDEVARRAAADAPSVGELRLTHLYTDADLFLTLPDYRGGNAARAVLYHPLDEGIRPAEDGFVGSLGRSHRTIAAIYEADYVDPVADPTVVLHGCVPVEYTEAKLRSMMTGITATALRVQRLHEDVQSPLREVLSGGSDPSNGALTDSNCHA